MSRDTRSIEYCGLTWTTWPQGQERATWEVVDSELYLALTNKQSIKQKPNDLIAIVLFDYIDSMVSGLQLYKLILLTEGQ